MNAADFHPSEVPTDPGVYVFRDRFGKVIYVGKARNLRRRLSSYFQPSRKMHADPKLRSLIHSIADWNFETVRTEDEALILESRLIKSYAPRYNILMRDDKRYLLLKINMQEKFPTLKLARFKSGDHARYFGPFPQGSALKNTLEYLLARFGLRACRDSEPDAETRKRCLKRIVKDCCAPCTGQVTPEQYREHVDAALAVLDGDIKELEDELTAKMKAAALDQKYEMAARYREIAENLKAVFGQHNRAFEHPELPGNFTGPGAAQALGKALGLDKTPSVIWGFDISNVLGKLAVAGMVAFKDGRPDRANYRSFNIKTVHQANDFAMIKEAVKRQFSRRLAEHKPICDLLLIDGGKGQLHFALDALLEVGCPPIPVLGLAERNEEVFLPGFKEPLILSRHDPALRLLQAVRDEVHRFSITRHRKRREKLLELSQLDEIPGIGKVRKVQLLKAFGSLAELKKASVPEICRRVPGLGEKLAWNIVGAVGETVGDQVDLPPDDAE